MQLSVHLSHNLKVVSSSLREGRSSLMFPQSAWPNIMLINTRDMSGALTKQHKVNCHIRIWRFIQYLLKRMKSVLYFVGLLGALSKMRREEIYVTPETKSCTIFLLFLSINGRSKGNFLKKKSKPKYSTWILGQSYFAWTIFSLCNEYIPFLWLCFMF